MAVFVTGAANGMGAGVSRVLHEAGATVVLSGRDVAALEAVAADLPGSVVVPCDVTDEASVIAAVAAARDGLPGSSLGPGERGGRHRAGGQDDLGAYA
jgi:NADP-dependent 3-hydroxy acid dehydrogenase YdfG